MENMKTYTIKDILDGDSSSDEEDISDAKTKMNHFPWLKKSY